MQFFQKSYEKYLSHLDFFDNNPYEINRISSKIKIKFFNLCLNFFALTLAGSLLVAQVTTLGFIHLLNLFNLIVVINSSRILFNKRGRENLSYFFFNKEKQLQKLKKYFYSHPTFIKEVFTLMIKSGSSDHDLREFTKQVEFKTLTTKYLDIAYNCIITSQKNNESHLYDSLMAEHNKNNKEKDDKIQFFNGSK